MKKILIAVDGSEDSDKAISHGGELAKGMNSEIVLVAVQRNLKFYLPVLDYFLKKMEPREEEELEKKFESISRDLLNESEKFMEKDGVTKVKTVARIGSPAEEILKVAEEEKVDLIVIGSRGKSLAKTVFGSVSREVAMQPKFPVLITR